MSHLTEINDQSSLLDFQTLLAAATAVSAVDPDSQAFKDDNTLLKILGGGIVILKALHNAAGGLCKIQVNFYDVDDAHIGHYLIDLNHNILSVAPGGQRESVMTIVPGMGAHGIRVQLVEFSTSTEISVLGGFQDSYDFGG